MDMTLLKEGAIIMAIGMGTVFFFLIIMKVCNRERLHTYYRLKILFKEDFNYGHNNIGNHFRNIDYNVVVLFA